MSKEIKLPAQKINSQEPLEKYGIDSVLVMSLTRELEKDFGELSKTLLFEYQSINELAGYFTENHRKKLIEKIGGFSEVRSSEVELEGIEEKELASLNRPRFMSTEVYAGNAKNRATQNVNRINGNTTRFGKPCIQPMRK